MIEKLVNLFAAAKGFDYVMNRGIKYHGYDVWSVHFNKGESGVTPRIGFPQYVLVKGVRMRMAKIHEAKDIFDTYILTE